MSLTSAAIVGTPTFHGPSSRQTHVRWVALILAGLALSPIAWAQRNWTPLPAGTPYARYGHAMAFDSGRGRAILFGGAVDEDDQPEGNASPTVPVWEWDGSSWTQLQPSIGPYSRFDHAMAYDSVRRVTVLFSGNRTFTYYTSPDTWEWDGASWTQRLPATSPPARVSHAMAFDEARGRLVMFGGVDGTSTVLSDTWEWDGTTWIRMAPATVPPARYHHAMAYDSVRGRVVLFGGETAIGSQHFLGDTWEWDGTNWTERLTSIGPSPRNAAMAFDSVRGRTVLYGGLGGVRDTWEWDGAQWSQIAVGTNPSDRAEHAMARSPVPGRVLVMGGWSGGSVRNDAWELGDPGPVTFTSVAPDRGSTEGGDLIHLFGTRFDTLTNLRVDVGSATATIVAVAADRIDVRTPPGNYTVEVRLVSSGITLARSQAFSYLPPELAARYGNVGVGRGDREVVLLANQTSGDDVRREVVVARNARVRLAALAPSSRPSARFAVWLWLQVPTLGTLRPQPLGLGNAVLPTPLNVGDPMQPVRTLNNLDARLGAPNLPSTPAPSVLIDGRVRTTTPLTVTIQGVIEDDASMARRRVSLTNAIVLRVP